MTQRDICMRTDEGTEMDAVTDRDVGGIMRSIDTARFQAILFRDARANGFEAGIDGVELERGSG